MGVVSTETWIVGGEGYRSNQASWLGLSKREALPLARASVYRPAALDPRLLLLELHALALELLLHLAVASVELFLALLELGLLLRHLLLEHHLHLGLHLVELLLVERSLLLLLLVVFDLLEHSRILRDTHLGGRGGAGGRGQ